MNIEILIWCTIISFFVTIFLFKFLNMINDSTESEIKYFEKIGQCYQNKPISKEDLPEPEEKLIENDIKFKFLLCHLKLRHAKQLMEFNDSTNYKAFFLENEVDFLEQLIDKVE